MANMVAKKYHHEKRRKSRRPQIPINEKMPRPRRVIRRRVKKSLLKIIDHWNSLGPPFAQVRKIEVLIPPLNRILTRCNNDPRQVVYNINHAYKYFSSHYFIFKFRANQKNLRLIDYISRNEFSMAGQWVKSKGFNTWFELFDNKDEQWLTENLIRLPKLIESKQYDVKVILKRVTQLLNVRDADFKYKSHLITIANRLTEFVLVNPSYSITAALADFESYVNHEAKQNPKPYWYVTDAFWNTRFKPFIVKVGRFQDERFIEEI